MKNEEKSIKRKLRAMGIKGSIGNENTAVSALNGGQMELFMSYAHREEILNDMCHSLKCGFVSESDLVEDTINLLDESYDLYSKEVIRSEVEQCATLSIGKAKAEQMLWPEVTDCDKLDAAFEELDQLGVIAAHNFTCCLSCGRAEMEDLLNDEYNSSSDYWGGCFYHRQATLSAVDYGNLSIAFLTKDMSEDSQCMLGGLITEVCWDYDLKASWDSSIYTRVNVELDWKRRLLVS